MLIDGPADRPMSDGVLIPVIGKESTQFNGTGSGRLDSSKVSSSSSSSSRISSCTTFGQEYPLIWTDGVLSIVYIQFTMAGHGEALSCLTALMRIGQIYRVQSI